MVKEALLFLSRLRKSSNLPDPVTCNKHIHQLINSNCGVLSLKFLAYLVSRGYTPHRSSFNSVVSFVCKLGQAKLAEDIIHSMPRFGCSSPDVITYNSLIDGHCRNGDIRNACLVIERLRASTGFICKPDIVSFNSLFNGFSKMKMLNEVFVYMGVMLKCCSPNVVTYTTWIDTFCKSGDIQMASRSFNCMKRDGLSPNVVTFTCLIDGYCKASDMEVAVSLYEEMRRVQMSLNVVTYTALIDGFCKKGEMQRAEEMYSRMYKDRVEPNSLVYTTIIDGYFQRGDYDNAMKFLAKMLNQGMRLDIAAYGVIISGLCSNGKLKEATEIVEDMEKGGLVPPDMMILTTMMNAYFKSGHMKAAVNVYHELIERGFEPDVVAISTMVDGIAKNGQLHEAIGYFCVEKANDVMYTVLIDALCKEGDFTEVERLFSKISEVGLVPDKFMYTSWIAGLCRQGNLVDAFKLKTKMVQEGLELDLLTCTTLIYGLASKGLIVEARQVFSEMLTSGISPDSAVFDILIRAYEKVGNMAAASDLLVDMQTRGLKSAVNDADCNKECDSDNEISCT